MQSKELEESNFFALDYDFSSTEEVPCIMCCVSFAVHLDVQPLLAHLKDVHQIVIGTPHQIADMRQYALYWQKLRLKKLEDYCIVYLKSTEPGAKVLTEKFYLLCDELQEDYVLRKILREKKLKFLTDQKEEERRDESFSRNCIYCRLVISGGISKCLDHLTFQHGFSLGNPDNIVFGHRLLDLMEEKLNNLQCLYCEKTFPHYTTLRAHMRKKQHKALNPDNTTYDQFYILNHLKPGTPWLETKRLLEVFSSSHADGERSWGEREWENIGEGEEDDQLWTDWKEEEMSTFAQCLFCDFKTSMVPMGLYRHIKYYHNFDLKSLITNLSFYHKVKIINYIRDCVSHLSCLCCSFQGNNRDHLMTHMAEYQHLTLPPHSITWEDHRYLIPRMADDGLLLSLEDSQEDNESDWQSMVSAHPQELVFAEEAASPLPSILADISIREELEADERHGRGKNAKTCTRFSPSLSLSPIHSSSHASLLCLFCFQRYHKDFPSRLTSHLLQLHTFDYKVLFQADDILAAISYIRYKSQNKKCYVCDTSFTCKLALNEHRTIREHTFLPPTQCYKQLRFLETSVEDETFYEFVMAQKHEIKDK